jgi:DNA-binding LacI/PurR family transcriptional regulator
MIVNEPIEVDASCRDAIATADDLALICFDDLEHFPRLYPFLTVMAQPAETYGTGARAPAPAEAG